MRISKPPEERRREILETAMRLFTEKGYEETSMRDIAQEMGVVQGLCYRYFDSKQKLFGEAMDLYVRECCGAFLKVVHAPELTLEQKLDELYRQVGQEQGWRYHGLFHKAGNEELHQQLALRMCAFMYPHLLQEVCREQEQGRLKLQDPGLLVSFITYGQLGIMAAGDMPQPYKLERIRQYIDTLLKSQQAP